MVRIIKIFTCFYSFLLSFSHHRVKKPSRILKWSDAPSHTVAFINNDIIQQLHWVHVTVQPIVWLILIRLRGHPGMSCVSRGVFGYTHSAHPVTYFLNRSVETGWQKNLIIPDPHDSNPAHIRLRSTDPLHINSHDGMRSKTKHDTRPCALFLNVEVKDVLLIWFGFMVIIRVEYREIRSLFFFFASSNQNLVPFPEEIPAETGDCISLYVCMCLHVCWRQSYCNKEAISKPLS